MDFLAEKRINGVVTCVAQSNDGQEIVFEYGLENEALK
jgi:hypothetical protein